MEDKSTIAKRLYGRPDWPQLAAGKDARIKALKAEGLPRDDASAAAWQELAESYPPEPEPISLPAPPPAPLAIYDPDNADADFVPGVEWVYRAINTTATEQDAPDPGAAGLLQWARDNRDAFYRQIVPKALEIKAKQGSTAADEDALESIEEIGEIGTLLRGVTGGVVSVAVATL